jgi:PrtD family type I secretion system ABC transporter
MLRQAAQPQPINPLTRAFNAFRPALIATAIFSVACNLLLFVGPVYMMQVYDRVLSSRNVMTLAFLTGIAVFLLLSYAMLDLIRQRVLVRAGMKFDQDLNEPLFRAGLDHGLAQRDANTTQTLKDMDTVREFWTGTSVIALLDAPFAPLFVLVCFYLHFWLGIVSLVGALILLALALINEKLTRPHLTHAGKVSIEAQHYANSTMRNLETIHALGMQGTIHRRWRERHGEMLGWQGSASDRAGSVFATTKFVRQLMQVAILGTGAYLAIGKEITPGIMIAASIMMSRALQPVEQAVGQWRQVNNARQAWQRIQQLFASVPQEEERTPLPAPSGALQIESITVMAPGRQQPILKNLNFKIDAGEILAVIGPSAAGKSTLARVLVGVWPVGVGNVRIDGADLRHWDKERLGQYLGYLPQDVELFSGTVAQNIARFRDEDPSKIIEAAELAGVHRIVQKLPDGYDTPIGEAGSILSGGQRQRIGLARALYGDPRLVVLDEPNSHLDQSGEEALTAALRRVKERGITVVVVTHKPQLLAIADNVLVLSEGSIKAYGPPRSVFAPPPANGGTARSVALPGSGDDKGAKGDGKPMHEPKPPIQ